MTEAEQKQKDRQKRDLRDGVEKGYERIEEMTHTGQNPRTEADDDAGSRAEGKPDRHPIEARGQRDEELARQRDFPQSRKDRAWRRQKTRQQAGAAENFPSRQRRDRQNPILDRSRVESHASSSARAFNTSSRTRSQTSTRKARYSRDLRWSPERSRLGMRMSALIRPGRAVNTITRVPR